MGRTLTISSRCDLVTLLAGEPSSHRSARVFAGAKRQIVDPLGHGIAGSSCGENEVPNVPEAGWPASPDECRTSRMASGETP